MPQVRHVTRKRSSPIGQKEMEKGVVRSHKLGGEGSTSTSDSQAVGSHRLDGKGPTGTHYKEKGSSGDFYDELKASQMSNCRSHRYTSDAEGSHRYRKD